MKSERQRMILSEIQDYSAHIPTVNLEWYIVST